MNADDIDEMTKGYLVCALFTNQEDLGIDNHPGEFSDIGAGLLPKFPKAERARARELCAEFYAENAADLAEYPADCAGHDLWYTRNGHGCGYWEADHTDKPAAERLTAAAHRLGECSVYRSRGRFYFDR